MRIDPKPKPSDLTDAERRDRQDRADFHVEEAELEYGPLSRDASFDERWPADDFNDGNIFDPGEARRG